MKRLFLLMALAAIPCYATNGFQQIGIGVKSKGMGGVGIALPQDSFASAANPAGLAWICDRFDVGLHWARLKSEHIEHPQGGDPASFAFRLRDSDQNLWWPEAGINWRFACNQALGVTGYVNGEWRIKAKAEHGDLRRGMEYGQFIISPAWAWKLHPCHSIGIAVNVAVGRTRVIENPLPGDQSVTGGTFLTNRDYDYEWGVSARFGWTGQFGKALRLGITYQTPTCMSLYRKYRGFIAGGGDLDLPAQLGIGLAWYPLCNLVAGIDVVKVFWRDGKMFRNANNADSGLFGANNGPGFGWNEQMIFKFGLAWEIFRCLTLRIGYNYGNTVLPPGNPLNAYNMCGIEDHVTFGATVHWACNELSICYVHGFRHTVSGPLSDRQTQNSQTVTIDRVEQDSVGIAFARRF